MNARALIPTPARRVARLYHRWWAFRGAMHRSGERIAAGELPEAEVAPLSYGWGNEGYSADSAFLAAIVKHAASTNGPILECGSGLSTILLSAATRATGSAVWSLENDPAWAGRVRRWLRHQRARSSTVDTVPLKDYGSGFHWYDPELARLPRNFSLVVCDGPAGSTPGGRYGLVPVMRNHFAAGCVILLDDANRESERATAERWAQELGATMVIEGVDRAFARLTLPS